MRGWAGTSCSTAAWARPRDPLFSRASCLPGTEFGRTFQRRTAAVETLHEETEQPGRRTPRQARVEAALLVSDGALSARRIAQCAALLDAGEAKQVIDELNVAYDAGGSAFRIERVGPGYQMLTRPVFARWLDRIHHRQERLKLSPACLETLAVVAYRQPLTRADIEAVRGVATADILKQLMERGLVKIVGEDDSLGRPYLYGTTRQFLEAYGLRSLDDMPHSDSLRKPAAKGTVKTADVSLAAAPESGDQEPSALAG